MSTAGIRQKEKTESKTGERSPSQPQEEVAQSRDRPRWWNKVKRNTVGEQSMRTTTVLFVEFSKLGSIQKCMRDTLDMLTPIIGFKVIVTEKGAPSSQTRTCGVWSTVGGRHSDHVARTTRSHVRT